MGDVYVQSMAQPQRSRLKNFNPISRKRQRESQKKAKDRKGKIRAAKFTNADRIKLTYLELKKKHHFAQQTIVRAIDELLAKGFIEIRHHGGTSQHDATQYAVPPLVMNWRTWHPGMKPFNTREKMFVEDIREKWWASGKKSAHKL